MNLIPAFFIIDQENIGIRKKHAIKHTTYGITPYICVCLLYTSDAADEL